MREWLILLIYIYSSSHLVFAKHCPLSSESAWGLKLKQSCSRSPAVTSIPSASHRGARGSPESSWRHFHIDIFVSKSTLPGVCISYSPRLSFDYILHRVSFPIFLFSIYICAWIYRESFVGSIKLDISFNPFPNLCLLVGEVNRSYVMYLLYLPFRCLFSIIYVLSLFSLNFSITSFFQKVNKQLANKYTVVYYFNSPAASFTM